MTDLFKFLFDTAGDDALWQVLSNAATVMAVIFGGVWAYHVYIQKRQRFPRAELRNVVERLGLSDGRHLLRVTVRIENKGDVLISVADGDVRVAPVLPVSEDSMPGLAARPATVPYASARFPWPVMWRCEWQDGESVVEVEPAESHEIHVDFVLTSPIEVVHIYSYIGNKLKPRRFGRARPIGWKSASYHRVADNAAQNVPSQILAAPLNTPSTPPVRTAV